jgi:hypothetical protein
MNRYLSQKDAANWKDLIPEKLTMAAKYFFSEHERIEALRFYFSAADLALHQNIDSIKNIFVKKLKSASNGATDILANNIANGSADAMFQSEAYSGSITQMTFSRSFDNFSTYLKDLLSEIVRIRPEVLRSNEKEQLDFILSFESIDDLRDAIAEKKIDQLFYSGIADILKFFEQKLSVQLIADENQRSDLTLASAYRNLIVHNRGRINREFLKKHSDKCYKEGQLIELDWQDVSSHNLFYQRIIVRTDNLVSKKFGLKTYDNYPIKDT